MNHSTGRAIRVAVLGLAGGLLCFAGSASAAGGTLTVHTHDVDSREPVASRMDVTTDSGRRTVVRRAVTSGPGFVIDRTLPITLRDGRYLFRLTRGPEYRVITGEFSLERTALDERSIALLRMIDMKSYGYVAGDMAVVDSGNLPLRMAAEDLHVAAVLDSQTRPANVSDAAADKVLQSHPTASPLWIGQRANRQDGVLFYSSAGDEPNVAGEGPAAAILNAATDEDYRVAVADPFHWQLPVWLASQRIDGVFVLGDWLREGSRIERIPGRPAAEIGFTGPQGPGRYAEFVYWKMLEAGLRPVPLAGTGPSPDVARPAGSAVGYNRVYAVGPAPDESDERETVPMSDEVAWYEAVWNGRSMVTNGPLLRATLAGMAPGHRFEAYQGEKLELGVELHLTVRDPVDYLEVVHNGDIFYSARLDEFAEAGGMIPLLNVSESGWVMLRVVTQHEEHFRAAMTAPWFIDFEGSPRVSRGAVEFFQEWLSDCETELRRLPPESLQPYIEPVRTARRFWQEQLEQANVP